MFSINITNIKIGTIGVTIAIIIIVIVSTIIIYGAKEPEVTVYDNKLQIKALYGVTINYTNITNITLIDKNINEIGNVGKRINGADILGTLQGHFKSDTLGETLLFINKNSSPTILIERNNDKNIYLNFNNNEKTTTLYNELTTTINQNNNNQQHQQ